MPTLPEQQARQTIDAMLVAAGWAVKNKGNAGLAPHKASAGI
jgi:type I site-specific restriction endonuclease